MARFTIDGDELVLNLSLLEKLEGFRRDIRVPLSAIREVRSADDAWTELRGIRAPGTGIPGIVAVGTRRGNGIKDFTVVHGPGPAVVVEMEGAEFDRFVVSDKEASMAAADLQREFGRP